MAFAALAGTAVSSVIAWRAEFAWAPAALFLATSVMLFALALRPAIEIHEDHLRLGRREILWTDIRRVDQTSWKAPLALYLTLTDGSRVLVLYADVQESCAALLRSIRRHAREALLDGVSYRQFWGEPVTVIEPPRQLPPPPRARLLLAEDEEEIERMFQRLKTVGHIDQRADQRRDSEK
jgi:hypothetical protein